MNGAGRGLGRRTELTVAHWDRIVASMPVAPRIFGGAVPDASPGVAKYHHMIYLDQRARGMCFPAGTPVLMGDGSWRLIEGIRVGDSVLAGPDRVRRVTNIFRRNYTGAMIAIAADDRSEGGRRHFLECTEDHRIGVLHGKELVWRPAGELMLDDCASTFDGLAGVRHLGRYRVKEAVVYDIEVGEDHCFIAAGLLVHNCVGYNLCSTIMTRLRIPPNAGPGSAPLPAVALSPLYQYDVARKGALAEGIRIGNQDGAIGSVAIRAAHVWGCCPWDLEPSGPDEVDRHPNDNEPPAEATAAGRLHIVQDFALGESFGHGLELNGGGFALGLACDIPEGMLHTDERGFFRMTGPIVGGHLFTLLDYSKSGNWAKVSQSWAGWGEHRPGDPAYAHMGGYTQIGTCPLDELESFFPDSAISSGRSEIVCPNTVVGFDRPILVHDF